MGGGAGTSSGLARVVVHARAESGAAVIAGKGNGFLGSDLARELYCSFSDGTC